MKPATLDRKVRSVESEGRTQAKWWLGRSDLGPESVQMALAVLISTQVRTDNLRGTPTLRVELISAS